VPILRPLKGSSSLFTLENCANDIRRWRSHDFAHFLRPHNHEIAHDVWSLPGIGEFRGRAAGAIGIHLISAGGGIGALLWRFGYPWKLANSSVKFPFPSYFRNEMATNFSVMPPNGAHAADVGGIFALQVALVQGLYPDNLVLFTNVGLAGPMGTKLRTVYHPIS